MASAPFAQPAKNAAPGRATSTAKAGHNMLCPYEENAKTTTKVTRRNEKADPSHGRKHRIRDANPSPDWQF